MQPAGSPVVFNFNIGSAGDGGSSGYSGGTITYVQAGPVGYYDRNFEAIDSQTTFPKPRVSPYDLITRLAAKTPRPVGTPVTASTLADKPKDGGMVKKFADIVSPVGDLIGSLFSGNEPKQMADDSPSFSLSTEEFVFQNTDQERAPQSREGRVPFFGDDVVDLRTTGLIDAITNDRLVLHTNTHTPGGAATSGRDTTATLFSDETGLGVERSRSVEGETSHPLQGVASVISRIVSTIGTVLGNLFRSLGSVFSHA